MRVWCLLPFVFAVPAFAQASAAAASDAGAPAPDPVTLSGYVEADYQWNFGAPSNGITHLRGFDNRHNTFTVANVVLDAQFERADVLGRLALQVGHTPSTYYAAEPTRPGAPGTNATDAQLWKYVQQAYAGYRFDVLDGLAVTLGVFLSPIGPEGMAVRDHWTWSRSTLFFGLPFFHTGLRAALALNDAWTVTLGVLNGWNSVVDGNDEKTLYAHATFTRPTVVVSLLAMSGVERPAGAAEGRAWRQLLDAHVTWHATTWLSLLLHVDGGFEPNRFGTSAWVAGAAYARLELSPRLFFVARGDVFFEGRATSAQGTADAIFFPAPWVSALTATVDFRPHERVSFRLEYRHDHAAQDVYFAGRVEGDGAGAPYVPNRRFQDTVTLGVTAGF